MPTTEVPLDGERQQMKTTRKTQCVLGGQESSWRATLSTVRKSDVAGVVTSTSLPDICQFAAVLVDIIDAFVVAAEDVDGHGDA